MFIISSFYLFFLERHVSWYLSLMQWWFILCILKICCFMLVMVFSICLESWELFCFYWTDNIMICVVLVQKFAVKNVKNVIKTDFYVPYVSCSYFKTADSWPNEVFQAVSSALSPNKPNKYLSTSLFFIIPLKTHVTPVTIQLNSREKERSFSASSVACACVRDRDEERWRRRRAKQLKLPSATAR